MRATTIAAAATLALGGGGCRAAKRTPAQLPASADDEPPPSDERGSVVLSLMCPTSASCQTLLRTIGVPEDKRSSPILSLIEPTRPWSAHVILFGDRELSPVMTLPVKQPQSVFDDMAQLGIPYAKSPDGRWVRPDFGSMAELHGSQLWFSKSAAALQLARQRPILSAAGSEVLVVGQTDMASVPAGARARWEAGLRVSTGSEFDDLARRLVGTDQLANILRDSSSVRIEVSQGEAGGLVVDAAAKPNPDTWLARYVASNRETRSSLGSVTQGCILAYRASEVYPMTQAEVDEQNSAYTMWGQQMLDELRGEQGTERTGARELGQLMVSAVRFMHDFTSDDGAYEVAFCLRDNRGQVEATIAAAGLPPAATAKVVEDSESFVQAGRDELDVRVRTRPMGYDIVMSSNDWMTKHVGRRVSVAVRAHKDVVVMTLGPSKRAGKEADRQLRKVRASADEDLPLSELSVDGMELAKRFSDLDVVSQMQLSLIGEGLNVAGHKRVEGGRLHFGMTFHPSLIRWLKSRAPDLDVDVDDVLPGEESA